MRFIQYYQGFHDFSFVNLCLFVSTFSQRFFQDVDPKKNMDRHQQDYSSGCKDYCEYPQLQPHLLVLPATFGLHLLRQTYPYFPALYEIPVRQAKGLPTASFRFHLAMDTLAVQLCASSLPTRTRDSHPLEPAHGGQTAKRAQQ